MNKLTSNNSLYIEQRQVLVTPMVLQLSSWKLEFDWDQTSNRTSIFILSLRFIYILLLFLFLLLFPLIVWFCLCLIIIVKTCTEIVDFGSKVDLFITKPIWAVNSLSCCAAHIYASDLLFIFSALIFILLSVSSSISLLSFIAIHLFCLIYRLVCFFLMLLMNVVWFL